jgi:signal transduction histidine kinase
MPSPLSSSLRDPRRLASLGATELMDSPPEQAFDRLTERAVQELGVPTAVMSLVDDRRQFFKSAVGLEGEAAEQRGTPLSHSFCQHVVHTGTPLRVEDARRHPLVRDNLAVRDLEVIAYLGMPLVAPDGEVVGSLCAISSEPHSWSAEDADRLSELAAKAMEEIGARVPDYREPGPDGEIFDLRALVDAACEHVSQPARRAGLLVTAWIDHDVPLALSGDSWALRHTLDRLLSNAIAFTPAGHVNVRVRMLGETGVRVEVADSGVGIAPEDAERVFEPFFQTSSGAALRPGAAGLGLPAAKRLVEQLGGEIGVRSRPGDGSTFHFTARVRGGISLPSRT